MLYVHTVQDVYGVSVVPAYTPTFTGFSKQVNDALKRAERRHLLSNVPTIFR